MDYGLATFYIPGNVTKTTVACLFDLCQEYPDYYTLIKKPIDMAKINTKLYGDQYQTLDDFMSDFHLMFDNACRYNEPDSQVYKVS